MANGVHYFRFHYAITLAKISFTRNFTILLITFKGLVHLTGILTYPFHFRKWTALLRILRFLLAQDKTRYAL